MSDSTDTTERIARIRQRCEKEDVLWMLVQLTACLDALKKITAASEAERAMREEHNAGQRRLDKEWKAARMHHGETIAKAKAVIASMEATR